MVTPRASRDPGLASTDALARLAEVARAAGASILAHYGGPVAAESKGDRGPVTAADRAAHRVIADALAAWAADVPLISEEGEIPPYEVRRTWSRFWLVDPLDGTKEFIKRNGEFTVNIALIDDGEPVLGVVYAPALDLLYYAGKGLGAWKIAAGAPAERIATSPARPGEALVVVESRSHPSPELEAYLATLNVARRVHAGSSLKFCWVAEGKAHLYPRLGPTMEWDVAAGDCVYRNATRDGENPSPLRYNGPDLRNDSFVLGLHAHR